MILSHIQAIMKVEKELEVVPKISSGLVDLRPCVVEHNPEYNE